MNIIFSPIEYLKAYLRCRNFKSIHLSQYLKQALFPFCATLHEAIIYTDHYIQQIREKWQKNVQFCMYITISKHHTKYGTKMYLVMSLG